MILVIIQALDPWHVSCSPGSFRNRGKVIIQAPVVFGGFIFRSRSRVTTIMMLMYAIHSHELESKLLKGVVYLGDYRGY